MIIREIFILEASLIEEKGGKDFIVTKVLIPWEEYFGVMAN